jgi:excisionase family DNA binding protein
MAIGPQEHTVALETLHGPAGEESVVHATPTERTVSPGPDHRVHNGQDYLTDKDMAKIFKVNARTIARWRQERRIPYFKIGSVVRYRLADVNEYLDKYNRVEQ